MDYCYGGVEWLTLSNERQESLKDWISRNLKRTTRKNDRVTSYGLKHIAERRLRFYISNADMKKAMAECGFSCYGTGNQNWFFNVSQRSINEVSRG